MFFRSTSPPLLYSLLSNMASESDNSVADIPHVEFALYQQREAMSLRLSQAGHRVRAARRLANTLMPNEPMTNNQFMEIYLATPLSTHPNSCPRLQRQNAMPSPPARRQRTTMVLPPPTTPIVHYVHTDLKIVKMPHDFKCAICLNEESTDDFAHHPCKCHAFHHTCLLSAMEVKRDCPMCRRIYNYWFV